MHIFRVSGSELLLLGAALLFGAALLLIVMRKLRGNMEDTRLSADEQLTNFRNLHHQGVLSDEEYRTIKTRLTAQLQQELNKPLTQEQNKTEESG